MMTTLPDAELDACGLACPLPVLRTNKALKALPPGGLLRVRATDPGSVQDMPQFCRQTGHQMVEQSRDGDEFVFLIRKAP